MELVLANGVDAQATVVAVYEWRFGLGGVIVSTDLLAALGGDRWFDGLLIDGDAAAVSS